MKINESTIIFVTGPIINARKGDKIVLVKFYPARNMIYVRTRGGFELPYYTHIDTRIIQYDNKPKV